MNVLGYRVEVRALSAHLGGGFVAFAPDLKGCLADGASPTLALLNLEDAIRCWIEAAKADGRTVPVPLLIDA